MNRLNRQRVRFGCAETGRRNTCLTAYCYALIPAAKRAVLQHVYLASILLADGLTDRTKQQLEVTLRERVGEARGSEGQIDWDDAERRWQNTFGSRGLKRVRRSGIAGSAETRDDESEFPEADRWLRFFAGDRRAAEDLCRDYQRLLFGLARGWGATETDAQDLLQEVLLRAFRDKPPLYNGTLRSWLLKVAKHLWLDEVGSRWRSARDGSSVPEPPTGESPLEDLLEREALDQVRSAMVDGRLTEREIEVINGYLIGHSTSQIAARLVIANSTVRGDKMRAISKLRTALMSYRKERS